MKSELGVLIFHALIPQCLFQAVMTARYFEMDNLEYIVLLGELYSNMCFRKERDLIIDEF